MMENIPFGNTQPDPSSTTHTIGIDIRKIHDFGIGTYIRHLLRGLAAADTESGIVYRLFTTKHGSLPEGDVETDRFRPVWLDVSRRTPFQGNLPEANRLSAFHAPHYLAPDCRPAPLILTVHDCIHLHPPPYPRAFHRYGKRSSVLQIRAKRLYHRYLASFLFKSRVSNATEIIAVSDATARELLDYTRVRPGKITRIYNCLDDIFFQFASERAVRVFCKDTRLPYKDYVLYCGNDLYHKNLPALLVAWKDLGTRLSPPRLVLAGPPGQEIIRRYAKRLGIDKHILFLKRLPRSQMPLLYGGALCLVLPSLAEGFGLPVIEAMISGTPVACSDLQVLREITGGHACFFNPADPRDISATLAHAMTRSRGINEQVQQARHYAERYSPGTFISEHRRVYNRVLEAAR
jgi:glycosyltransferase involved in cell wall biosynthesis